MTHSFVPFQFHTRKNLYYIVYLVACTPRKVIILMSSDLFTCQIDLDMHMSFLIAALWQLRTLPIIMLTYPKIVTFFLRFAVVIIVHLTSVPYRFPNPQNGSIPLQQFERFHLFHQRQHMFSYRIQPLIYGHGDLNNRYRYHLDAGCPER